MKLNRFRITFCLIIIALLALSLPGCQPVLMQKPETLTVGLPALEQNALIYIAADQGYFIDNNLYVVIQNYDSGVTSMDALLQNHADLAIAAEFPVARSILKKDPVAILASIDQFENDLVVARKDRGIAAPADLKGKRVGVAQQTINEFYLARFLELNHVRQSDVTLVNLSPDRFVSAIATGQVDALIAWQPYIYQIEQQLKDTVTWPAQNNQLVYGVLVARKDWLADHPETAARFLKSLLMAEDFLARHPDQAKAIVQKQLKYSQDYLDAVWAEHQYGLTLDYSLVVAMTDEARWLIQNNLSPAAPIPNFVDSMYLDGIKAIKPEAVDIIR